MKAKAIAFIITVFAIGFITVSAHAQSWHTVESWTGNLSSETNAYFYSFHGPFLETGVAYSGLINVTVSFSDQAPLKFSMSNGQDYSFSSQHQASSVFWNLTADYAHTRQVSFGSDYSDEVYLYVGGSGDILSAYSISVTDFAGLSNATLETDKNVLGVNRIVERQNLDVVNNMNFYLVMYSQYTLKLVSDQGTFTWSLPADSVVSKSFVVTMDMVTQVNDALNMTVSATRLNATSAQIYFNDPNQTTTSITTNIYARNATGQYLFYTQTDLGYSQNFTVYTLAAATNYVATITTAQGLSWTIPLSTLPSSTSIWGVSFDVFGDWTYLAKNGIGMFIVMTLISVGSWKDTEWFLAAGIVVAAFMVYIGMLSVPWAGISAALLVVVLMYIDKGKKEIVYS